METGTLEKKIAKLPENLKLKVEVFVNSLLCDSALDQKPKLKREFGSLKGFVTYMADDFDAPLDEMKEYM